MKKTLFSLAIFCFIATSMFAQKKIKGEGYVKYKIESEGTGGDDGTAAMLQGTTIDMYMSGKNIRINAAIMGGMMTLGYIQKEGEEPVTLMDMMGQKMRTGAEAEQTSAPSTNMTYTVNKRKTKKIVGYKCHEVKGVGEDGIEMTLYVTKKIKLSPPKGGIADFIQFNKLDGYPLECSIGAVGELITFTAQEVGRGIKKGIFEYDKEEYKEMSDEDMEGMGMDKGIIGL
ncbi:MAG: hypothetical protein ACI94Y_001599 [Maribacter sp.]|jgi:hypothetical protein